MSAPKATPSPPRANARRLLRFWPLLLILPLVFVASLAFLTTEPGEKTLAGWLEKILSSSVKSTVRIGRVETDLLTHLTLTDLKCFLDPNDGEAPREPYLSFEEGRLDFPVLSAITGRLFLRNIRVKNLKLDLRRRNDGRWEAPLLNAKSPSPPENKAASSRWFTLSLQNLEAEGFLFHLEDLHSDLDVQLQGRHALLEQSSSRWTLDAELAQVWMQKREAVSVDGQELGRVRLSWDKTGFNLERVSLNLFGGSLSAQGSLRQNGLIQNLRLKAEDVDAGALGSFFLGSAGPAEGVLRFDASFQGFLSDLRKASSRGHLELDAVRKDDTPLLNADVDWSLAAGVLDATFLSGSNEARLKGALGARSSLQGVLTGSLADPGPLAEMLGWPNTSGRLAATGSLSGTLQKPRLEMRVDGEGLRLRDFPLDHLSGSLSVGSGGLRFHDIRADGFQRSVDPTHPPFGAAKASGGFRYELRLSGSPSDPVGLLTADLTRPGWGPVKLDRGRLEISAANREIRLDLFKGQRDTSLVQAEGRWSLTDSSGVLRLFFLRADNSQNPKRDPAAFAAKADLSKSDPKQVDQVTARWKSGGSGTQTWEVETKDLRLWRVWGLAPTAAPAGGRLTLSLKGKRIGKNPTLLSGGVTLKDGTWSLQRDGAPIEKLQAEASLDSSQIHLRALKGVVRDLPFEVTGHVPLPGRNGGEWDLGLTVAGEKTGSLRGQTTSDSVRLEARLNPCPAALAEPFLPFFSNMDGRLAGHWILTGSPRRPLANGSFTADHLSFFFPLLNAQIAEGGLSASFQGARLVLDVSKLRFNGGLVTLSGGLGWGNGLENFAFQTDFSKVPVLIPRLLSGTIAKGRAAWTQKADGFLLDADLDLSEGRWLKDFTMDPPPPPSKLPSMLALTRFAVRFRGANNVFLDNNWGRIRVDADATMTGTWGGPTLMGRFTALEGWLKYLDRKFTLTKGSAQFQDPSVINPYLSLQAETQVRSFRSDGNSQQYLITLAMNCPLDRLSFNLASEPSLPDADIATLLTLGATRQDFLARNPQSGSSAGDVLTSRAGSFTTNALTDLSARKVGQLIGLEELAVEGNPFGGDSGSDGSRISATTRVTDRVNVTYRTNTGSNPQRAVRIGYFLSNRFSLVTEADQSGQSSLDLKYKLLFK